MSERRLKPPPPDTMYKETQFYKDYIHKNLNPEKAISKDAQIFKEKNFDKQEEVSLFTRAAISFLSETKPTFSASTLVTRRQQFSFLLCIGLVGGIMFLWPPATIAAIGLLYVLLGSCIMGFRGIIFLLGLYEKRRDLEGASRKIIFLDPPVVTILIPLYKEHNMINQIATAIEAIDYPQSHLDVKVLLEENDSDTIMAAQNRMRAQFYHFIVAPSGVGPQTKPRACNLGLWAARGKYIVIYDAEDEPEPDQIMKAVIEFTREAEDVACLQARLGYYNARHNMLTRLFALEYVLLFDFLLPGLARLGMPLPLGGTSNIFKTAILKEIGGWDPFNVTEDADVGMRLGVLGYRSAVLQSTTYEQATSTFSAWITQRSRWIKGFIQTWLVHTRNVPKRGGMNALKYKASLHLVIGAVLWAVYLNPIFGFIWFLLLFDTFSFLTPLFPGSIGDMAFAMFIFAGGLQILLMGGAPVKRGQWGLIPVAVLAPFYWALQAIAGAIALGQIFLKPYYWEKTPHFARNTAEPLKADEG